MASFSCGLGSKIVKVYIFRQKPEFVEHGQTRLYHQWQSTQVVLASLGHRLLHQIMVVDYLVNIAGITIPGIAGFTF